MIALSGGFFPAARATIRPERERNGLVAGKGPALSVGQGRSSADSASAGANPAPPARKKCRGKPGIVGDPGACADCIVTRHPSGGLTGGLRQVSRGNLIV